MKNYAHAPIFSEHFKTFTHLDFYYNYLILTAMAMAMVRTNFHAVTDPCPSDHLLCDPNFEDHLTVFVSWDVLCCVLC